MSVFNFKRITLSFIVLITIILLTVNIHAEVGTINVTGSKKYSEAWKVLDIVNEHRTAEGLTPLAMDSVLLEAAMLRAAECAVYYSHDRPNDTECFTVIEGRNAVGENIAVMNYISDASRAMDGWMNSPGHKANIMFSDFTSIGIGVFEADGMQYWTQLFDGGDSRSVSGSSESESATYSVEASDSKISLEAKQNTDVKFHGAVPFAGSAFAVDDIYNKNTGWEYASLKTNKSNLSYQSSDTGIVTVSDDGIITPVSPGKAAVSVNISSFPDKTVLYNVDVTAHEFADWQLSKAPTCIHDGEETAKCIHCDDTQIRFTPATGVHIYDGGVITIAPTAADDGELTYTCTTCGVTYTEAIAATGDQAEETTSASPVPEVTEAYIEPPIETTAETTGKIVTEKIIESPAETTTMPPIEIETVINPPVETTTEVELIPVPVPVKIDDDSDVEEDNRFVIAIIIAVCMISAVLLIVIAVIVKKR